MAGSTTDSFFEQILTFPAAATAYATGAEGGIPMMLQLSSGNSGGGGGGACGFHGHGVMKVDDQASGSSKLFRDCGRTSNMKSQMEQQKTTTGGVRGRVRAKRGHNQALLFHSLLLFMISFSHGQLRRERIAERIRALQELVPSINKTDRAVMLDEILDYVKFLQIQVKVLSISRMGGAAVPLDIPILSVEEEEEGGEKKSCSGNGIEKQVVKLMEENNIGAAMQFLQSKSLCIMPLIPLPSPTTTTCYMQQQQLPLRNH